MTASPKVCALLLVGVLFYLGIYISPVWIFCVGPVGVLYLYILWVIPSRQILLQEIEEVQGVFFTGPPPKSSMYRKVDLG